MTTHFLAWCRIFNKNNAIKFVSDLRQVGGFRRVIRFSPPIKLTATTPARYNWNIASNEVFLYTSCDQTEMKGVCCTADETAHLHRQKKIGFTRIQWWKQKEKKKEQTCYIKYEGKYFSAERLLICRKNKIANEMSLVLIWIIQLYVELTQLPMKKM
jgi:hypothetical protein